MKTLLTALILLSGALPGRSQSEVPFSSLHEKAKWRERRIIQNNDGGEARVPRVPIRTKEDFLALRATPLIGSQVDTIIYDTTAGSFGSFAHDTKAGEPFLTTAGRYRYNALPGFLAEGTDPLKLMVEFARTNGVEIIWALRMNDTHDATNPLLMPRLKKEHPEWLLSSGNTHLVHGKKTSVDYGQEAIRKMVYRFVEEVAQGYDIDGVELDFFRHPVFFKSVATGGKASDKDRARMSELIRKIRKMTYARGKERGKPLLLSIRIPDSVEYCHQIGLDVEKWFSEGLIDFASTTCYFQLNPWSYTVELGKRFDIPVYPCLSESRIAGASQPWSKRSTTEVYRARAANAWQAGAKGLYLFNAFDGAAPWWREIGSPRTLVGLDKRYFATVRVGNHRHYLTSDDTFDHLTHLSPDKPKMLPRGEPFQFPIDTAEDFEAAKAEGKEATVLLRLDIRPAPEPQSIQATLNDAPLTQGRIINDWLVFPVEPALLRKGINQIALRKSDAPSGKQAFRAAHPGLPKPGRIRIEEMEITPNASMSGLTFRLKVQTNGAVIPQHVSIRTPGVAGADPAPEGFKRIGGYTYPSNWETPGYPFAEGKREITIDLPIGRGKEGSFTLRVIALGSFQDQLVRDDNLFSFEITDEGVIHFPEVLHDAHIDVTYTDASGD